MVASGFLLELVNNVLDMNKLESGKVQLEAKTFCVRDLVEESAAMVEAQTAEKTLTLRRDIRCDRSDRVIGSPLHVRQVLQNLLSNAVRYNRVGGEIFLSVRETARTEETVAYEFVVRDTGVGMSEAFVKNELFRPFTQEKSDARTQYKGTGLGMSPRFKIYFQFILPMLILVILLVGLGSWGWRALICAAVAVFVWFMARRSSSKSTI